MIGDEAVAAELCQETLLRAFRAASDYRVGARIDPWIFRIARNLAIDHLRRSEHRYPRAAQSPEELSESTVWAVGSPERITAARRSVEGVERCLAQLRPAYREVLLLGLVQGWTYDEISAATGDSVSAVKARFLRARLALRRKLEEPAE